MHPMSIVKDHIKSELQQPTDMSKFERMKEILSRYRGKSFRAIRRQAIQEHQGRVPKTIVCEPHWLKSLKQALKNRV